jgi:hypothetical protein
LIILKLFLSDGVVEGLLKVPSSKNYITKEFADLSSTNTTNKKKLCCCYLSIYKIERDTFKLTVPFKER